MDESYFNSLDSFQRKETTDEIMRCCDNIENYMVCEENTKCRVCDQEINILNSNPEKCYEGSRNTSRIGMPTSELLPDSTTGSVIQNNYSNNANMRIISRLNMYQGIPYKTRSLLIVFNTISENCNRNGISKKIINESQGLYKIISKYKISRGSNRCGIISACIFMACKNCGSARSSSEISKVMNIEKKVVTKGIKQLQDIIRVNKIPLERVILDRVTAADLIDRVCNDIQELDYDKINDIKLLCDYFNENHSKELSSCTPPSLSAAIVNYYIITNNLDIDKNTISEYSGVSVVTIQKITNILISII
jgi:transcription initiation factor TFIIIB Brf1 subunit/transcription initiation factor TFIIB